MALPKTTLEQWRALVAVVDAGGYAQAAEHLNKSQSTVTYAVKKLETALGVHAFAIAGRRAVLTPTGQLLYRRARVLLEEARRLERAAQSVSAGWEALITLSVDVVFPVWLMLECLARFSEDSPHTHIELIESVISGAREDLLSGKADLAITNTVPPGFLAEALMTLRFVPAASPAHPLHMLERDITLRDLRRHRHLVVRESGVKRAWRTSLDAEQRWTMSTMSTSIGAACRGFGFAWYPEYKIRDELNSGQLKVLPLARGGERFVTTYLVVAQNDAAGPGVHRLAQIIRDAVTTLEPTSAVHTGGSN